MCIINPFSAIRPANDKVAKVATHSVERYSKEEIDKELANNPISFLHVINPESDNWHATQTRNHLDSVKSKLQEFVSKKVFITEE